MEIGTAIANCFKCGFVMVREDGTIGAYNDMAKDVTGVVLNFGTGHPEGKICKDDIVIIADNELGNDDGLTLEDLKLLNISDTSIKEGDTLLAVGVYKNDKIQPIYKYGKNYSYGREMRLSVRYLGFSITADVDSGKRNLRISVDGSKYSMNYLVAVGHMVVIDGNTGQVKFFQAKGYGIRGEEIGKLLRGKSYMAKNPGKGREDMMPTIGRPVAEVLNGKEFLDALQKLMTEEHGQTTEDLFMLYKRMLYCRLVRIKTGEPSDGVYVFIQDIEMMESIISSGNILIKEIEQINKKGVLSYWGENSDKLSSFIGNTQEMIVVKNLAYKASKTKFNVLLTGESGTGKSKLAREIHDLWNPEKPFVEVNCSAIAESLFESELFGYVPGAFTGATSRGKVGYLEEADGGTIFLDEIGELPWNIQVKLLYVLQYKRIYRVGSTKPINIDVRIIMATNRNLEEEVKKGNFRQDLYYRINVFPIDIPPLREHKRDLYVLANSILTKCCQKYDMPEKQFSEEALEVMGNYDWPGNVRELENIIERATIICDGGLIYSEHLMLHEEVKRAGTLKEHIDFYEKQLIKDALYKHNNDRKKAMEELGISKTVFYEKLKKYQIDEEF